MPDSLIFLLPLVLLGLVAGVVLLGIRLYRQGRAKAEQEWREHQMALCSLD
jgi:Mn-dependent DtxR family transcriptional regulator